MHDNDKPVKFSRGLNDDAFDDIQRLNDLDTIGAAYDEAFHYMDVIIATGSDEKVDLGGPLISDRFNSEEDK